MPIFEPKETTKITALAQLERRPGAPPGTRIDYGSMSAGAFQLLGSNIDEGITMMKEGELSPEFTRDWQAHLKITDPVTRKTERQRILQTHHQDLTAIGARWTKTVQDERANMGYETAVPVIMAHNNPTVTRRAILELTGLKKFALQPIPTEDGKVRNPGDKDFFQVAQGAWTTYVGQVGQKQAEKNLLKHIQAMRVRDFDKIVEQEKLAGRIPPQKPEDEFIYRRAERLLTEPLAGTSMTLFDALQNPAIPIEALPPDLIQFFKNEDPGLPLSTDAPLAAAVMKHNRKEKALAQIAIENGENVHDPVEQMVSFWDIIFKSGDLTRAATARALARIGISAHQLDPADIPTMVSGDQFLDIAFGYRAKTTGDVKESFTPDLNSDEPIYMQALDFLQKIPEINQTMNEYIGSIGFELGTDPVALLPMASVLRFKRWLLGARFEKEQQKARKALESFQKRQEGIDFSSQRKEFLEELRVLKHLEGDTLTRAKQLLKDNPLAVEHIKAMHPNTPLSDAQATLMALKVNEKGQEVLDFIHTLGPQGMGDPVVLKELKKLFGELGSLTVPLEAGKTATGRGLRALQEVESKVAAQTAKSFEKVLDLLAVNPEKAAQQLANFKSPLEMAQFMRQASLPGWGKVYNELLVNGLLSGPLTLLGLNPLGNTAAFMMDVTHRQISSLFGRGGVPASEATRMILSAIGAVPKGLQLMARTAFSSEKSIAALTGTRATKLDLNYEVIAAHNFPNMPEFLKPALNWLGVATRFPSRLMLSQDEGMKAIFYQAELSAQAGRLAQETAGWARMSWKQKVQTRRNLLQDMRISPEKYPHATKSADFFKHRNTFTSPGGPTMEAMVELANSHPVLKALFPFIRTPTNIMKRIASDAGFGSGSKLVQAIRTGDKAAKQEALGRLSMASLFLASVTMMSQNGILVGGKGSTHPGIRSLMREELGQHQGALAFDTDGDGQADRFLGFNPRTHVGQMMNLIGQFTEARGYSDQPGEHENFIQTMSLMVGDLLNEAPFVGAISGMFEILGQAEAGNMEAAVKASTRMGATYLLPMIPGLPFTGAGARGQITRTLDPTKRDTTPDVDFDDPDESGYWKIARSLLDQILVRTPSFSTDFIPDYSPITGQVHQYPQGTGPFDYESDPTPLQLVNTLVFPTNVMIDEQIDGKHPAIEVARWMVREDVNLTKFDRKYAGIQIPNDLYQQWKYAFATGRIPDLTKRNAQGGFDDSSTQPYLTSLHEMVLPIARNRKLNETIIVDEETNTETTSAREAVFELFTKRKNAILQKLLATDPHWIDVFGKGMGQTLEPNPREPSTPSFRRSLEGISLSQ